MLKELDITAFGKRMRIANAIQELHRPASVVSSDNSGRNGQMATPGSYHNGHGARQSLGSSVQHSVGSPNPPANIISPESPPHTGDFPDTTERRLRPESDPGIDFQQRVTTVGLGLAVPPERPVSAGMQ